MAADFSFWWPCSAFRLTLWLEGYVERFLILALTVGQAKDCQKYSCWLLCQSCPKANAGRSHNKNPCSISARKKGKKDTNLQFYPTKPLVSTPSGQLLSLPLLRAVGRTELCGHVDFMTFPSRPDSWLKYQPPELYESLDNLKSKHPHWQDLCGHPPCTVHVLGLLGYFCPESTLQLPQASWIAQHILCHKI